MKRLTAHKESYGKAVEAAWRELEAKNPHSAECGRRRTGMWDRTGNCARCKAFITIRESEF